MPNDNQPSAHSLTAVRPEWLPLVEQAAQRGSARGLPRPAEFAAYPRGAASFHIESRKLKSGERRCTLIFSAKTGSDRHTIGGWSVSPTPPPSQVAERVITVRGMRYVIVTEDGLPRPIPEEIYKRNGGAR